jgi:hypothetical protein
MFRTVAPLLARFALNYAAGYNDDPRQILHDASDPRVPTMDVMTRAYARSRHGHLPQAAADRIARRPALGQILGNLFGAIE